MQVTYFLLITCKYFDTKVRQQTNNIKHDYVNIHHWEFDLSRPAGEAFLVAILYLLFFIFLTKISLLFTPVIYMDAPNKSNQILVSTVFLLKVERFFKRIKIRKPDKLFLLMVLGFQILFLFDLFYFLFGLSIKNLSFVT